MSEFGALVAFLRDPRLTAHATSALPVWLWSADASRVLWANPTGAAVFNAPSPAALIGSTIDPKGTAALQIARLAATLAHRAAPRLERLRGFGGRLGRALMCACVRVTLADRTSAILVMATEPAGPNLSLDERVRRLLDGIGAPVAVFGGDGTLLHATAAGQEQLLGLRTLKALGIEALAGEAMTAGQAKGGSHVGAVTADRIGTDAAAVLLVTLAAYAHEPASPAAAPSVETPAIIESPPEPVSAAAPIAEAPAAIVEAPAATQPHAELAPAPERRQPLRFGWQMDAQGGFTLASDEFIALIGPRIAGALERSWSETAAALAIDPAGQVARAVASRDTWSGLTVHFPVERTDERIAAELSGLPVFDRERTFLGYRGFGICRDAARITALMQMRRDARTSPEEIETKFEPKFEPPAIREDRPTLSVVPPSENVVPFRGSGAPDKQPSLTPVERTAFRELASRLTERLRNGEAEIPATVAAGEAMAAAQSAAAPEAEARPPSGQHAILDRLPVGVLVYRLDRLIYANRAFLDWTGYEHLQALTDAGSLDALFAEPSGDALADKNGSRPLSIATKDGEPLAVEARLFSSPWEGESALVLMITRIGDNGRHHAVETAPAPEAQDLNAILDAAADAIVMLDRDGLVVAFNRSAGEMFGYHGHDMATLPVMSLIAPESRQTIANYLDRAQRDDDTQMIGEGREVIGRTHQGRTLPLFLTIGRMSDGSGKVIAFFRDITAWKKAEEDLLNARHRAEMASSAKSDFLAKISHEIRTPLNAIIGFSEVMMAERFGPVGNDRYRQYLKDIHASGEHLVSLLNDLIDLSKIEAGRLELNLTSVDLNELTQQCVALMQPQASRERIIIRTSLTPLLPPVVADARSVRQIVLNLLSNSIKFTTAGGQVIVSTAINDTGEVALRVRDTGVGMSEKDIAVALEPFRQLATSARYGSGGSGLGLPLTKALAEANRASFRIRSAVNAGTLVEVAFPGARMAAE